MIHSPIFHKESQLNSFRYLAFLFSFFCFHLINAQEITDKQILKHIKGKEIEWIPDAPSYAKVKMKSTKKWGIYIVDAYRFSGENNITCDEVVAPKFDSIGWFKKMEPFTVVKNNKKYGILLNPYEIPDAVERANCIYDAVKVKEVDGRFYSLVKQNEKWGLVDWFEDVVLVNPTFDNPEDVPLVWIEGWAKDMFVASKKKLKADVLIFDEGNGDGVFKARNKATKKWGMYQSTNNNHLDTLIPPVYDSLNFFTVNSNFTLIYQNDKVGVYLSKWSYRQNAHQSVSCIYDNHFISEVDGITYLAMQKEGKWGWVNWLTGEEQSEFQYNTVNDLPYPSYLQEIWFKH